MKTAWLMAACIQLVASVGWAASPVKTATVTQHTVAIDPVADVALLSASLGFGLLLELIVRTGELRPQAPVDSSTLLPFDRWRAESDFYQDNELSNVALGVMGGLVVADIILMGALDRGDDWSDYLVIYGESVAVTLALTDLAKIAVRRPRPEAYQQARDGVSSDATNTALSFFSGHASIAGALAGTAAYLAWVRGDPLEAWIVSISGGVLAAFVATMRVIEGKHFPTDVLAGSIVGVGVGVLIPHFHRSEGVHLRASIIDDGAIVGFSSTF